MAFPRSNVPVRLQQILSGGRAAIPSLKLESEPPPDVKAFIDRVIKSPLQDIDIPLSGFRWEFNKGNFHHWRPLFLHFDTYFKTYISCRKDLRLSDDMLEEDVFPKHSVLQILRVMQIILTNCHNKSSFSGLEHFRLLLSSTDPEILLATLETLSALVKINPSKLHGSGKSVGCGSLNNSLMSLAQGWGSKEEGLGLFSCVVTNEKSQQSTLSLFPSDIDDDSSGNQNRMGSTLHFEFRSVTSQVSNMCVVHIPGLHLRKEDDLTILKQCVDMYNVPIEHRFPLLTRIRYAHAFRSPRTCSLYTRICILAFVVLVQSGDAHDELVSFFANEPEYTNELIRLVRAEEVVPDIVKALSMFALGAELAAYTFSHERGRILSGSSIISAGGNRMLLLTVLQKAILSLTSQSDPSSILLVEALLQFFLLHVLSSSSSGSAIRGSGLVSPLLPLLKNTESAHVHLVCSAVKTLQKLMEYSSPAVSLFKDLGGVETLSQRLEIEVRKVTGPGESSSTVILGESSKNDVDRLYTQKRLIKVLLKALGSATYSPANSTRSLNPPDKSLLESFSLIFQSADRFGAEIYFSAVTVMSEILHKDPTCFPVLEEFGIPKAFLSSVSVGVIPSSKALICIPGALGAMCLNTKGLEYVKDTSALWFLENAFTTKKYLAAMNEGVVLLANAVEELLRHVSSLRSVGVDIIIKIVSKLASIGEDKCPVSDNKVEDDNAMEVDVDDKENMNHNLVDTMESDSDDISNEQFLQLCVFHVLVLVHRTVENSETCRLFVEKKGIDVLIKLLLQPCIAQSSEGMPVALHSTVVFKSFTQHHSSPLALAFCSALRSHVDGALGGLKSASSTFLLDPKRSPDSRLLSPLFVIEFLLFLAACKDHRWVAALLSEFGNGSKDVLENIGKLHREVLWQISLLENSKSEMQAESPISSTETQIADGRTNGNEEQRFNYMRRYLDPLSRRRTSGLSIESQFLDLIGMYQGSGRIAGGSRRAGVDVSGDSQLVTNSQSEVPNTSEASSVNKNEADKQKSYYSSCRDMMKSLSYHIDHLFQELGKAMLVSSRRGSESVNMSSSAKSVVSIFSSIILDHLKFTGPIDLISDTDVHVPTRCRYLGKVTDFIDTIILDKPDTCNPILINCFYSSGVIDNILTTFEDTSQVLLSVNRAPASPMETDEENLKSDEKEETENSWIYGPLSSYGSLMDHLVTSSFIMSSSTKQLLEQPLIDGDVPFPRGAEAFVKVLQSKVLKAVLPIWNHPRIAEYSNECISSTISTIRHVFSGVDTRNVGGNPGARLSGPPPDESTISLISEMGFSRSRAEEALRQVGTNSVELATDWLFSHPEEPQDDDELARALKLSLGNSGTSSSKECSSTDETFQEVELAHLPPVDELLSTCIRLLHADESLAFPVKDLLLTISTRNDGEFRSIVVEHIIGQLKGFALYGTGDKAMMSPLFHVLALLLHEDETTREIANKCGLVTIVLHVLSQWDPSSSDGEKPNVPKWVTSSFLAIDLMLQLDLKLAPEAIALEKLQRSDLNHQTSIGTDENKSNSSVLSPGKAAGILEVHDRNRLIDLACKCIKSQLPSDTMHAVLQMCATLTRVHSVALAFLDLGGLPALLNLPTGSMFPGFDNVASAIIRHILEDPNTLQQAMESEIRHSLVAASNRHLNGRVTPRNFVQNLSSVISRDPAVFMKAAQAVCQIEMSGDRPYVVLLKDHDKDKAKEREKEKVTAKEKVSASNSKPGTEDAGSCKQPENNNKSIKVHRKIPPNFSSVIELLLDSVTLFVPSTKEGDAPGNGNSSANMDIDGTSDKVKGKAVAMSAGDREIANQEALVSLAKSVFMLKLLTEILLTFPLAIQVLLRRDSDISNFRTLPRGNPSNIGGGIFHHILHKFLPHSGPAKKDKKSDTDWRQKLAARAKQFLVASSVRSGEARKRIFSEIHKVSGEFVDSSVGCMAPDTKLQAFIDVLNEMLSARTSTGSYISAEASATFIDVGLVGSLTRLVKILDLDHADSPKIVSGIIKALELVTKEYAHSAEPSATKGGNSTKMANEHNDLVGPANDGNRFRSLETMSQPDQSGMMADHMDSVNAAQNSGSSDSVTDEMDHDRDLDGSFSREGQDYFMRETSEAGRSTNNGVTNVEIFDIPRNAEDNLDDEEDDEDMSGDEGEMDEEEDDDENNDLEEDDIHHMSHPETDQDDHDVDEEFDEDVLEEEEDDEDDEDGVILRLEEGIHGINVFDQIELLGPGGNNLSNETLRVMPLEVFGSRRRSQSIYDLMGRAAGHAVSSEHPLLSDPSLGHVGHQRRSVNVVEAAFSDRSTESSSSRFDSVFRSLVRERHAHRFSMWVDDTRQRVGSTANLPQGIEDVLLSLLRRPTPEGREQTNQVISPGHCPEQDETHQTDEVEVGRNEEPREGSITTDANLVAPPPPSPTSELDGGRENGSALGGVTQQEHNIPNLNEQVMSMQYERSDPIARDVEAVSLESGGSSATLGESLRSLEVEIGSADGHDDGERQGEMHQVARSRRPTGSTITPSGRDPSLESVSEVPVPPRPSEEAGQDSAVEQQPTRNASSGSIDPTFLEALPEELRAEVLSAQQNQTTQPSNDHPQATDDIDPEFLAALPPDIRAEVLAQQQAQRVHQSQELEGQPVEMDTVSIIATFPSDLREEVLLTSPDNVLASLTPALVAEANMLRERFAHRYHGGTLFGMHPRNRRGESSRRGDAFGSNLDRIGGSASRRSSNTKMIEVDGAPLVKMEELKAMIRLLRVVQPLYKGQLQRLLLNLCSHSETRSFLLQLLMDMLLLDVRSHRAFTSVDDESEPLYRLYGGQSYIAYSRPQFSDGVPPLVSRRILETLTYLSRNHPNVARLFLHLELPKLQTDVNDNGRGKAVVMEEDNPEEKKGNAALVLLLSLLNQPLYSRSVAHLEQLLTLLEVVVGGAESDLNLNKNATAEQVSGAEGNLPEAPANAIPSGSSSERDVKSAVVPGKDNLQDTRGVLLSLPEGDLQRLCSLLAHEGLSDGAYTLVAEILKKLVAIVPHRCQLFVTELANSVQKLSVSAINELRMYDEMEKSMINSSSSDGTAILRVLQALSSLVSTLHEKKNDLQLHDEKGHNDALSSIWSINTALEPLWSELSASISKIEVSSESTSVASSATSLSVGINLAPPLPVGSQNILPYIESFFVTCEKIYPEHPGVQDINSKIASGVEDALTSGSGHKMSGNTTKADEKHPAFMKFSEKHRKILNAFIRQNPGLLEKSFSLLLKVPRFIDFDNKRAHFRTKIKHQNDHHHSSLRISVRRAYILEDSYNQLRMRSPQDLKGRLTVHFQGEEGIDAGGLTREWYQLLSRVVFDKGALLFTTVGNESTFQPNPNSVYQTEHLSYFKFVGRVVGKALFDGQLLDVHFTRSFYKHILGVKVTYHDIEAIDPDYFKNLKWMLENYISDTLGLTFSIDADEEKLILYEKTEVTDHELIPGGRNIRVTEENKHEYVDLVAEHRLTTAIRPQINAFMEGFNDLISRDLISIFNDKELELLISGLPDIDFDDLRANTEYSGYSNASPVIQWFWEVVQGLSKEDKARLLQFVTGTSKVPLEGFSALQGISGSQKFQIHKAYGSPDHLPSAHTCFNQLDLPEYPSKEQLQERLLLAIHEGSEGFGFG